MNVRRRLSNTANISLMSSSLVILILFVIVGFYGQDALHLLTFDRVQSFQQLTKYSQSDKSFALIRTSNIVNTEIYVTVDELFGEKNYYGYIAQLEDKYFLFFSSKASDENLDSMILSKWWSQAESMNVFRQMVVDDLTNSSEFSNDEVENMIFSTVFLNIDDIIESSIGSALGLGFLLFIMMILFYESLKLKLGIFSDKDESVILDYDLHYLDILYTDKHWMVGEKHIIYHGKNYKILNIEEIREVHFYENRVTLYFDKNKATIFASAQLINRWMESWKIQRRHHDEPVNQL